MHLIITEQCKKNCSFCFTDCEARRSNNEMSIYKVKTILDKFYRTGVVGLMGGEPTEHSQFKEIMEEILVKRKLTLKFYSNFLFNDDMKEFLLWLFGQDVSLAFVLINGSELDEGNRIEVFKKNYLPLFELLKDKTDVGLSITIDHKKTIEDYEKYYAFLKEHLPIKRIRIGLDLVGGKVINNKKLGDIVYMFIEKTKQDDILLNGDCQIPYCIFKNKDMNLVKEFISDCNECLGVAADIKPNGNVAYCFPTEKKLFFDDVLDFNNPLEVQRALGRKYIEEENKIGKDKECQNCDYFLSRWCHGICMGCRK